MKRSYIWSVPTRVFHWLFAFLIVLALLTSDIERFLNIHALIGYGLFIVLFFRIIWGFIAPKYSHFSDFSFKKDETISFLKNPFTKKEYIGHNPVASIVMIIIYVVVFFTIISGILTYGIQDGRGILSFLNNSLFNDMELFEEIHELFSNFLLLLIGIHLSGIFIDRIKEKNKRTLNSIIDGYKITKEDESISLNYLQKIFFMVFIVIFIGFIFFAISSKNSVLISSKFTNIDYEIKNELFVSECASCHIIYPPEMLNKKSWINMMANLENHFGDDASLDEEDTNNILKFLLKNSSETSTKEYSFMINKQNNGTILSSTKTDYWKDKHKEIDDKIFKKDSVKSKANCKACHSDIEKGLIEDENIKDIDTIL